MHLDIKSCFDIQKECETKPTGNDGSRKDCGYDPYTTITAPANHVIDDRNLKVDVISMRGSENDYDLIYEDWIPILENVPEITYPQTLKIGVFARSPKGRGSGSGKTKIGVHGCFISLNKIAEKVENKYCKR